MTARFVCGGEVADRLIMRLSSEWKHLDASADQAPVLAVLMAGENISSPLYDFEDEKQCQKIGLKFEPKYLPGNVSEENVLAVVRELNTNDQIHGIMIHHPLPRHLNERVIIEAIAPEKDVEGIHPVNLGRLFGDDIRYLPLSAYIIMEMIEFSGQPLYGKIAAVVGDSDLLTKSLALLLLRHNISVSICHPFTNELPDICRQADILVSVAGKSAMIKGSWIKPGAIVIDRGAIKAGEKSTGVILEEAREKAGWIFSIPEGITSLTIAVLMKNILGFFKRKSGFSSF